MKHVTCWSFLCLLMAPSGVAAQPPVEPIGPYVLDLRGTLARFKEDPAIAGTIAVPATSLPTRGLGVAAGAHWYALRYRGITLGLGGELVLARGSKAPDVASGTIAEGPVVTTRLSSISPQVSLNFGTGNGWSYISGGIGRAGLSAERGDAPSLGSGGRTQMTNYGGGARWFTSRRLAFTFDVRFYAISERTTATRVAFPRARLTVISVGASLR